MDKFIYQFEEVNTDAFLQWWLAVESGTKTWKMHPPALIPMVTGHPLITVDMVAEGNLTLSGVYSIDSQPGGVNKKVLAWMQTDPKENCVYLMKSGAWVRYEESDSASDLNNQEVFAGYSRSGSTHGTFYFTQIKELPVPGIDDVVYERSRSLGRLSVPYRFIRVDSVYGNDTYAEPYRFNQPYRTLEAAVAAALPGDTLDIYGDFTITGAVTKTGITYKYNGCNLTKSIAGHMFDLTGKTGNFKMVGVANFTHTLAGNSVVYANGVSVDIHLEFHNCTAAADALYLYTTGHQYVRFKNISTTSSGRGIYCRTEGYRIDYDFSSIASAGHGIEFGSSGNNGPLVRVRFDTISSSDLGSYSLYSDLVNMIGSIEGNYTGNIRLGNSRHSGFTKIHIGTAGTLYLNGGTKLFKVSGFDVTMQCGNAVFDHCAIVFNGSLYGTVTINSGYYEITHQGYGSPYKPTFTVNGGSPDETQLHLRYNGNDSARGNHPHNDNVNWIIDSANTNDGCHQFIFNGGTVFMSGIAYEPHGGDAYSSFMRKPHRITGGRVFLGDMEFRTSSFALEATANNVEMPPALGYGVVDGSIWSCEGGELWLNNGLRIHNRFTRAGDCPGVSWIGGKVVMNGGVIKVDDATSHSIEIPAPMTGVIMAKSFVNKALGGAGLGGTTWQVGVIGDIVVDANVP